MSPPKGGGNRKKKGDGFPRLEGHREGPKFLIVKRMDMKDASFEKVSPIFINKGIKTACGEPLNIVKLRDGTLLVKTKSVAQANQLLRCKMLFEMAVSVEENSKLNQTKGIITSAELRYATMEEIKDDLADQGVCQVDRMMRKKSGVLEPTNSFILTFNASGVPEMVKVGYLSLNVRLFIPRPIRCYKCQYYGHPAKFCSTEEVCSNCCEEGHKSDECSGQTMCRNCKSTNHSSWSTECAVFKVEQEVMRIKVTEGVSMREAKNLYKARNPANVNYSDVVKGNQGNSNSETQSVDTNQTQPLANTTQVQTQTPQNNSQDPAKSDSTSALSIKTRTQTPHTDSQKPGTSSNSAAILNSILDEQMEVELLKLTRPRSETSEEDCVIKKIKSN